MNNSSLNELTTNISQELHNKHIINFIYKLFGETLGIVSEEA
jgi:hypothetical protein